MSQSQSFNNYEVAFIPENISNISSGHRSSEDLRQSSDSNIFVNQFRNQNSKQKIEPIKQDDMLIYEQNDRLNKKNNFNQNSQNFINDIDSQNLVQSQRNNNILTSSHNSILQIKQYEIRDFPKNNIQQTEKQKTNKKQFQIKNNEHFVYGPKYFQLNSTQKEKYAKQSTKNSINHKQKPLYNSNKKIKASKSGGLKTIQNAASKIPLPLSLSIYSSYSSQQSQPHNDQHTFTQRMTQTDVISQQKQQFLQEQIQTSNINSEVADKNKKNIMEIQVQELQEFKNKTKIKKHSDKITIIKAQKYDQKEIQQNALYNNLLSSYNFVELQLKELILFNRAHQIQIQKEEIKDKIIQNQICNNNMKIFLRNAQETKHINFCSDFQYKRQRCKFLNVRKKVDNKLRTHCEELSTKIKQQQDKQEKLQKELKILQFYYQDFKKKVNFSYIFKQRKIQELIQDAKIKIKEKSKKKLYESTFSKSQKLMLNNKKKSLIGSNDSLNSITSIQNKRRDYQYSTPKNNLKAKNSFSSQNLSLFQIQSEWQNGSKIKQQRKNINKPRVNFNDYQNVSQRFDEPYNNQKKLPIQNFCQANLNKGRLKKYFYYQCQQNLKQMLEQMYLGTNLGINQKQLQFQPKILSKNHRKILFNKMQLIQNQILEIEVDTKQKIKQMQNQNQILKKQNLLLKQIIYKINCPNPEEINKQLTKNQAQKSFKNKSKITNAKSQSRLSVTKLIKQVKSQQFLFTNSNQIHWDMKLTKKNNFNKNSLNKQLPLKTNEKN